MDNLVNNSEVNDNLGSSIKNQIESESNTADTAALNKPKRPNKTQKKLLKYQKRLDNYQIRKANKKQQKIQKAIEKSNVASNEASDKLNVTGDHQSREKLPELIAQSGTVNYDAYLNKRELKRRTNERLAKVCQDDSENLKICIDCSFSNQMSGKELSKLAQQIGRCYASNKTLEKPVHLTLCNLSKDSDFYAMLVRLHDGFERYFISITDQPIEAQFADKLDSVCYMSPDSPECLEAIHKDTVYVIGG